MSLKTLVDRSCYAGCLLLIGLNQLAFGGLYVFSQTLTLWMSMGLVLLFAFSRLLPVLTLLLRADRKISVHWIKSPMTPILVGLTILGLAQLIPLPPGLVDFLSPRTAELHQTLITHGILDTLPSLPLSLDPFATKTNLLKFLSVPMVFALLMATLNNRKRITTAVLVFVFLGVFQVLYGTYQVTSPTQRIWWWEQSMYKGYVTGTYLNRNHLAGFLELATPLSLGLAIALTGPRKARHRSNAADTDNSGKTNISLGYTKRKRSTARRTLQPGIQLDALSPGHTAGLHSQGMNVERRGPLLKYLTQPGFSAQTILLLSTGVILGTGLLLTGSRGGILAFSLSALLMSILMLVRRNMRNLGWGVLAICLIILCFGLFAGLEDTARRFEQLDALHQRLAISKSVLPMLKDFPLTGVGLGNFNEAYSPYSLSKFAGRVELIYAHNDWLQLAIEMGWPGLFLGVAGLAAVLFQGMRLWRIRQDPYVLSLSTALLMALISISLHSLVDFNLHIPANALSFAAALALLFSVLHLSSRHRTLSTRHMPKRSLPLTGQLAGLGATLGLVTLTVGVVILAGMAQARLTANLACPFTRDMTVSRPKPPSLRDCTKALALTPDNAEAWSRRGQTWLVLDLDINATRANALTRAARDFEAALTHSPIRGEDWFHLAQVKAEQASLQNNPLLAKQAHAALSQSLRLRPRDSRILNRAGEYWLWHAGLADDASSASAMRERAHTLFQKALKNDIGVWETTLAAIARHYPIKDYARSVLPQQNDQWIKKFNLWWKENI